jgi:peptide-methionine (S)-S-oxide reductase
MENGQTETAVFGGGCFWCTEAVYKMLNGVISVTPGYAGGFGNNPTYDEVCSGLTGHAEVVKIEFDPSVILYEDLLTVFFATHDPTTLNRQGDDIGTQYRSIILYANGGQKQKALDFIKKIDEADHKIVTEVKPLESFYEAEDYHRDYYFRNKNAPYCEVVISPKLAKLQERFSNLLKNQKAIK